MRAFKRACTGVGKTGLLAGTALVLVSAGVCAAQTKDELPVRAPGYVAPILPSDLPKHHPTPPPRPPEDDGLGPKGFYLEADTLIRDDKQNVWTARGRVEARYQGRVIRGDEVIYQVAAGTVAINGHAQIINTDGTAQSADHLLLDDKLRAGFARGFATLEPHNIRFAADVAIRRSETVNELDRAVFTPCNVCTEKGSPKTPTWSIQASKVIEDHTRHVVYYRNAVIRVKGLPILYAPVFWHPDPDSPRASGLLMPQAEISKTRGGTYQQTYYWAISPYQELYVTPQINTSVAPLLGAEYRERFYSGAIDIRGGYTYERDFDGDGHRFGDLTSRSYILADGAFNINKDWSWGFTADRTSDRYIFEKYDIPSVYSNQSQYTALSQELLSQVYVNRQDSQSYISVSAVSIQGIASTDNNRSIPLIAPLVEAHYEPSGDILGGRLQITGSGVMLSRSQSPTNPLEPGIDSKRASGEINWLRSFTLGPGLRLEPFLDIREDVYGVSDSSSTDTAVKTYARTLGNLGLDVSWPFIRQGANATIVLEPLAQVLIAPNISNNPNIPNEDSQVFTFDETNLFSIDKFAGYDLVDGGDRLNVAGRATINWGDGESARLLIGRSFRTQFTNAYPPNTGLNGRASNWVVAADTTPVAGLSLFGRALLNNDANVESQEVGIDMAYDRARGYVRYATDNTQPTGKSANVEAAGEFYFTKHWGVSGVAVRDLTVQAWRLRDVGLLYKDECIKAEVIYQHQDTIVGALRHSDAVFLRLTLATLGDQGYTDADYR